MSLSKVAPVPRSGEHWREWAERLADFVNTPSPIRQVTEPRVVQLAHIVGGEKASKDGLVMYDPSIDRIVYARAGAFQRLAEFSEITLLTGLFSSGILQVEAGSDAIPMGDTAIDFATPFASVPIVLTQYNGTAPTNAAISILVNSVSTTSFDVSARRISSSTPTVETVAATIGWIAIGNRLP